jgi:hypothetical protein
VRQTQYEYLWVLTAVCPRTGAAEGLISPCLNSGVINGFLQQFSAAPDPAVHAVLVWDGAGFHTAGALKIPENVTILKMPPRSPELMPVENLWHYEREHHWVNRKYADYAALEAPPQPLLVEPTLRHLGGPAARRGRRLAARLPCPGLLKSICADTALRDELREIRMSRGFAPELARKKPPPVPLGGPGAF